MKYIKLSKVPSWQYMDADHLVNWLIDEKYAGVINDYGFGIELELDDLVECWPGLKDELVVRLLNNI